MTNKKPEPLDPEEFERIAAELEELDILFSPPSQPMPVARKLMKGRNFAGLPTLLHWRNGWMRWVDTHWVEIEERTVRSESYQRLEQAVYMTPFGKADWDPTQHKINDVTDALRGITHLPEFYNPPCWLPGIAGTDSPMIAATNGLLDVHTRELRPLTPGFFNLVSVPFPYDPNAPAPTHWLEFLHQLWPDDEESIEALCDWFGYALSGRTDLQKIFLIIGPLRSGKGTISRVLSAMLGKGHVANPTLSSLATEFGLAPLLGKSLAVIGDARLGSKTDARAVIERLLSISGEDAITVNRKFRDQVTVRLPTRFMIISNELPAFGDASGAIASRFIITTLVKSFLGRENIHLEQQLLAELPGILNWALEGLDRISRQSFTVPKSSEEAVAALQDLVSPMSAFVRDLIDQSDPSCENLVDSIYQGYRAWASDNGIRPLTKQLFGRDLRAVIPGLRTTQPHGQQRRYVGIRLRKRTWNAQTHTWDYDASTTHNASSSVSSVSPVSPLPPDAHETHETGENPLQRHIDDHLASQNGRCPECKWHVATQWHRSDCPHFKTDGVRA
jgi:putative DNA primase/helicase